MWHLEKIPRVIHLYWENDTISFLRYLTVSSFKRFNPDWQIKIYHPKKKYQGARTWSTLEHNIKFLGENYLEKLMAVETDRIEVDFAKLGVNENIPQTFKSDLLRWHILSTEGGVWSDFDIIYFKPMQDLYLNQELNKDIDTLVCLNGPHESFIYHSIGFLMSSPGNEFYKYINDKAYLNLNLQDYQSTGGTLLNTNFPSLASIKNKFNSLNLANLKMDVIYPMPDYLVRYIFYNNHHHYITSDTIGIHWYAGHPLAGQFENILTEDNFYQYDNVITQIITQVI